MPRFTQDARQANRRLVGLLQEIGNRNGATPAQIALAWLLSKRPWIVPIPGTTRLDRLDENLGAAGLDLGMADLRDLEDAAALIPIQGDRYPREVEAMTGL